MDNNLRITKVVQVGNQLIGGRNAILIQSMTDTPPSDIESTVDQCIRIFDAGAGLVRLATPAIRDAKKLLEIKSMLVAKGYHHPLAADVHYSANAAEMAAEYVEKVRINPGNYVDKKDFNPESQDAYAQELRKIKNRLQTLVKICHRKQRVLRIGVNHGSLSERIVFRYGDTIEGMAESVMEYLRMLEELDFNEVVVSIKSSNPLLMVKANRLLKEKMEAEGMDYPFHLGVTEAGEGEEGRIRSAMGIGALLWEGIGDTIRVSLTESPELEIPVAKFIVTYFEERHSGRDGKSFLSPLAMNLFDSFEETLVRLQRITGHRFPFTMRGENDNEDETIHADLYLRPYSFHQPKAEKRLQETIEATKKHINVIDYQLIKSDDLSFFEVFEEQSFCVRVSPSDLDDRLIHFLRDHSSVMLMVQCSDRFKTPHLMEFVERIRGAGLATLLCLEAEYEEGNLTGFQLELALDLSPLLLADYPLVQGFYIRNSKISQAQIDSSLETIFQVSRHRMIRTEFISCPGCGRTLFNLQETTRRVKEAVGNIKGLKVAVMGCMVNGPGEMADADVGYVGAGGGRVTLYEGKNAVKKNIPEGEALDELMHLLKRKGYV
jgi:(E)-4-hydroxy-3-methylbut-2-enyl-diphosphate synthase